MHDERTEPCATLQSPERKRCPACQQVKSHGDFSVTSAGIFCYCRGCQRAFSRLASRRRAAAIRLLIAAHPEEWGGLLELVRGHRQVGTSRPKGGGPDEA
jgi:hypothetical protein